MKLPELPSIESSRAGRVLATSDGHVILQKGKNFAQDINAFVRLDNLTKAAAALPDLLAALNRAEEWTRHLYAALPYETGQEAMRCHSDNLKMFRAALIKAGATD